VDPQAPSPIARLMQAAAEHKAKWITPMALVLEVTRVGTLALWKTASIRYTVF
jgi:hypothetical protein